MNAVDIRISATGKRYRAHVDYTDKDGVVHERIAEGERDAGRNSNLLSALIEGARLLIRPCMITVWTTSEYIVEPFRNGWVNAWEKNGWKNSKGNRIRNADQWQELRKILASHSVRFEYIKEDRQCLKNSEG